MTNLSIALPRAAADVVSKLTDERVTRTMRLRGGVMNDKFVVDAASGIQYVVRFYSKTNAHVVRYEPDLVEKLRQEHLPVAKVIGDSRRGPDAPLSYMAYEYLPGHALSSRFSALTPSARRGVACQLAEFLLSMGSLSVTGHGELVNFDKGHHESWVGFMEASFSRGITSAARHGTLSLELIRQIDLIRANLERFDPPERPTLAWGDILLNNLLVDSEGLLSGVVDFEGTLASEYALNLGYCRAAYGLSAQFSQYLAKSSEHEPAAVDPDRLNLYTVLRGVRVARFAHLPLPTGRRRRPVLALFPGFSPAARILAARMRGSRID